MSARDSRRVKTRGFTRKSKRMNSKTISGSPIVKFRGKNSLGRVRRSQET